MVRVVGVAFATDTCDREIIAWHATTGGINGEMVVTRCWPVPARFATTRTALADNGSAHTARETLEFAAALGLIACFTPVRRPKSNGVSEASVKTLMTRHIQAETHDRAAIGSQLESRTTTTIIHSGLRMRPMI
jgi:transposase InsO family protein